MGALQWIADHYPTDRLATSRLLRAPWRVALALLPSRKPIVMRLADYRMTFDTRHGGYGRSILRRGQIEPTTTPHFRARLKPGMTVADIGANIGHYTLLAARHVGTTGRVFAFEPEPSNFEWLERNIRLNEFTNVTARRQAVSNVTGPATLHIHAENTGGHSLDEGNVVPGGTVAVETVRLDDVIPEGTLDVMKIDVQGAEGFVIEGAEKLLARSDTAIYVEFAPYCLKRCGTDPRGFLGQLRDLGYRPEVVFKRPHVYTDGLDEMLDGLADSDEAAFNVLYSRAGSA